MSHGPDGTRILIVDDDELSRDLLTVLLEGEGYVVQTAESGEAALVVLGAGRDAWPHAVLADLQMPGVTGSALAGRMRTLCGGEVMLLAMSGSQPRAESVAGFDGFLLKPFTMGDLAGAIGVGAPGGGDGAKLASEAGRLGEAEPAWEMAGVGDADSVLDGKTFRELSEMMRPEQMGELYSLCLRDAEMHVRAMEVAAEAGDEADFRRRGHAMKGSFGMLGARDLQTAAGEMESRGPDATNDLASLARFRLAMGALRRILLARGLPLDSAGD